jgi:hypothetical protein
VLHWLLTQTHVRQCTCVVVYLAWLSGTLDGGHVRAEGCHQFARERCWDQGCPAISKETIH